MVFARDGKASGLSGEGGYPTTIIATNKSGKMLFIQADGRQTGFSVGIPFTVYGDLAKELDLEDAFIVDGGGSSTMVQLAAEGYKLVNRPSDKKSDGTYGSPRTVVNSVIVASGPDRNAPPATEVPTEEPTAPATENAGTATEDPGKDKDKDDNKKSGLGTGAIIAIIAGCVAVAAIVAFVIIKAVSSKKKK